MTGVLLLRKKWAIRYNWVIGILLVLLTIGIVWETHTIDFPFITALLTYPYWITLFKIQHRWEQGPIKG